MKFKIIISMFIPSCDLSEKFLTLRSDTLVGFPSEFRAHRIFHSGRISHSEMSFAFASPRSPLRLDGIAGYTCIDTDRRLVISPISYNYARLSAIKGTRTKPSTLCSIVVDSGGFSVLCRPAGPRGISQNFSSFCGRGAVAGADGTRAM